MLLRYDNGQAHIPLSSCVYSGVTAPSFHDTIAMGATQLPPIQVRRGLEPFCVTIMAVDRFLKQLYRDISTIVTTETLIEVPNVIRPSLRLNTTARLLVLPLFQTFGRRCAEIVLILALSLPKTLNALVGQEGTSGVPITAKLLISTHLS